MSVLLYVASALLSVTIIMLVVTALRQHPAIDVEGWHRRLRVLRETAQPEAETVPDEQVVVDTSERNVRLLSGAEELARHAEKQPESAPAPDEPVYRQR